MDRSFPPDADWNTVWSYYQTRRSDFAVAGLESIADLSLRNSLRMHILSMIDHVRQLNRHTSSRDVSSQLDSIVARYTPDRFGIYPPLLEWDAMDKDGITIDQMRARRSSKSSSTAAASTASIESSPIPLRFVVNARRRCVSIVRTRGEPGLRNCIEDVIDDYLTQHVHNPESFCELTEHVTFGERLLQYPDRQTLESDAESQDTVLLDGNDDDDELSGDNDEEEEEEDGTLKGTPPAKQYKRDRVGQTLD